MNKTWKWIFGIVLVLVLVGAMFAIGYTWQARMSGDWDGAQTFDRDWNGPMMGRGNDGWNHPMVGNAPYSMHGFGFVPFGGFFLLGGLVKLALFFGLLYVAYWLGRRNARITIDPKPAARVDASAAPEADSAPRKRARKVE